MLELCTVIVDEHDAKANLSKETQRKNSMLRIQFQQRIGDIESIKGCYD